MIPVAELLEWCKAELEDEPTLAALEQAAVDYVQHETGRIFVAPPASTTEEMPFQGWPVQLTGAASGEVILEFWTGSAWAEFSGGLVVIGPYLYPANGMLTRPGDLARVTYPTGTAEGDEPPSVRMAVKLLVAHWFEHREAVWTGQGSPVDVPHGVDRLLSVYVRGTV